MPYIAEFEKMCKLAKISINDSQKNEFLHNFSSIIEWIEQLNDINVSSVLLQTEIDDEVCGLQQCENNKTHISANMSAKILANASNTKFDMFSVPKVVE